MTEGRSLTIAYVLLPVGFAILTAGSVYGILTMVLAGCAIIGTVSYGFGYFASLAGVSELTSDEKPRAVAGYLLFAYLGFGIPSTIMGLTSELYGIENSLIVCLIITTILSIVFLMFQFKRKVGNNNDLNKKY